MTLKPLLALALAPLILAAQDSSAPFATTDGPAWRSGDAAYRLNRQSVPVATNGGSDLSTDDGLGVGGIGVLDGTRVQPLGVAPSGARVWNTPLAATVLVENRGVAGTANLSTTYRIFEGSRLTNVEARGTGKLPDLVAGIALQPRVSKIESPKRGAWRYVATWGSQAQGGGTLGVALFYLADEALKPQDDGASWYVRFCDPRNVRYAFATQQGDEKSFRKWLADTTTELTTRAVVVPSTQVTCPAS
jgi:hypothetical protein